MLSAILNGKGRRLPEALAPGASMRMAFTRSEDILTATVFERLAYLDGQVLWKVLEAAFRPKVLPSRSVVSLEGIEFWPTWGQAKETLGKAVEPDVVISLSVGDPSTSIALIVECKLDGFQYPDQWAQEWIAYRAQAEEAGGDEDVYLLALGGLPKGAEETVVEFENVIRQKHGVQVHATAAAWQDLRKAVDEVECSRAADRRILSDIVAALELHGFRRFRAMQDLARIAGTISLSDPHVASFKWSAKKTDTSGKSLKGLSAFAGATAKLRPVDEHRCLRWGEKDA